MSNVSSGQPGADGEDGGANGRPEAGDEAAVRGRGDRLDGDDRRDPGAASTEVTGVTGVTEMTASTEVAGVTGVTEMTASTEAAGVTGVTEMTASTEVAAVTARMAVVIGGCERRSRTRCAS